MPYPLADKPTLQELVASNGIHAGEDNADAHLKRQIMGREVVVAITKGKLDFGPWEQIFYGEFDGHRPKRVLVTGRRASTYLSSSSITHKKRMKGGAGRISVPSRGTEICVLKHFLGATDCA